MTVAKVEVERLSLTSAKPFDAVLAALKSAVGQPDMAEFFRATRAANSLPDWSALCRAGWAARARCFSRNSTWRCSVSRNRCRRA